MSKEAALIGREDVSRFLIHLTRDDRRDFSNGMKARDNLLKILKEKRINAYNPHCFFNPRLKNLKEKVAKKFNVSCFTEVPLNQIKLLTRPIPGRQIELSPYGIVFTRQFIIQSGGQPAIYVNGYHDNKSLRDCIASLYDRAVMGGKLVEPDWRILPFLNAMHERYDFTWEREWRVLGRLKFKWRNMVCVILPDSGEEELKERFSKAGVATVSPDWTYEQIVAELARQQRDTRRTLKVALKMSE